MTAQEFDRILKRYLNDTATKQERDLVEQWFNAMDREEQLDPSLRAEVQEKIWRKLDQTERSFNYARMTRIAAAISFVVIGGFLLFEFFAGTDNHTAFAASGTILHVENEDATAKRVSLPDGSVIILEPNSAIDYPATFGAQREVSLEGEAFFDVKRNPDHPFIVYAQEVTTRVLGTSFSVKASEQEKEIVVAVKTGKVSVQTSGTDQETIILLPNQKAVFNRTEKIVARKIVDNPQLVVAQSSLKASYVNVPVVEILKALEANYGVDILFDEQMLAHCTLTSDMSEVGLYERIEIICHAIGASYQVSEVTVIIDAKPCD